MSLATEVESDSPTIKRIFITCLLRLRFQTLSIGFLILRFLGTSLHLR
jgi:hypothetical protein